MSRKAATFCLSLRLCAQTMFFVLWSSFAVAGNATIAISSQTTDDPFFQTLKSSDELHNAEITLSPVFGSQDENLSKVLGGSADLALVDLDAFKDRKFGDEPLLASLFTLPFLFDGFSQAYFVQNSALGAAALNDVARTSLIALGYWNSRPASLWES
jgi:TRAP-type C4-dicarboxylate transport system substrate-binding protein